MKLIKEHFFEGLFTFHAMIGNFFIVWFGLHQWVFVFMLIGNVYWGQRWIRNRQIGALVLTLYYAVLNFIGLFKYI